MKTITKERLGEMLSRVHHIYYLKQDNKVVYVGQTKDLMSRLSSHYKSDKKFDTVDYYEIEGDQGKIDMVEATEIIKHKSIYNKTLPVPPETFGLIKEKKLPKIISVDLKERAFVMPFYGINFYDGSIIKEAFLNEN